MAAREADQKGIVDILTRLYREIAEVEEGAGIRFGGGDFRARIEYFHDAVRAYVAGSQARLTVELLAYDVQALRYIQANPLAPFNPGTRTDSQAQGMVVRDETLPAARPVKPDRAVKQRLAELYQQYGVLFSALLKPFADNDYQERVDALDRLVSQFHAAESQIKGGAGQDAAHHVEDPRLRAAVADLLKKGKKKEASQLLNSASKEADKHIKMLSDAHLRYGSSQLGLYEDGKDVVKKLAAAGMNLAGQFVEASMAEARRDFTRGR